MVNQRAILFVVSSLATCHDSTDPCYLYFSCLLPYRQEFIKFIYRTLHLIGSNVADRTYTGIVNAIFQPTSGTGSNWDETRNYYDKPRDENLCDIERS